MARNYNQQKVQAANRIQDILKKGNFQLKIWTTTEGKEALYLCKKDEQPYNGGVYIQHIQ